MISERTASNKKTPNIEKLRQIFGDNLQENVVMSNYTTANVGGKADALLVVHSITELEDAVKHLWELDTPVFILGSGSNVLVSDEGIRGVVIINHAHNVKVNCKDECPTVWAESGANISSLARQVGLRGLHGLEWACGIPGSIGGAVYGNAGAYGSDIQNTIIMAEILHPFNGKQILSNEQLEFSYRSSIFKREANKVIILSAQLSLEYGDHVQIMAQMKEYQERRRNKQPPGTSMGSIFKNPPGNYAARLIEAAGLKGTRIGGAEISTKHANFFVTHEQSSAQDIWQLIQLAQSVVKEKSNIHLELEIELLGEWHHYDK